MSYQPILLGLLLLFLTACKENKPTTVEEDTFPDFTPEQIDEMIAKDPRAQMELAKANRKQGGNQAKLIDQLEKIIKQEPDNLDNYYHLAKIYHQNYIADSSLSAAQKAIDNYSVVIQQDTNYEQGKAYYNRMLCYLAIDQPQKALADINKFVVTNQGKTPVNYWAMIAEIQLRLGLDKKACESYQNALELLQKDSLPIENMEQWNTRCS